MEKIFVCGDIVSQYQPFQFCSQLQEIIKTSCLSICNFEAPIFDINQKSKLKAGPSIYNYGNAIRDLSSYGFDLFCMANNHIYDYGYNGLKKTIDEITVQKKASIGASLHGDIQDALHICKIGDTKIAILNGGENQFGTLDMTNRFMGIKSGYIHSFDTQFYETLSSLKQSGEVDFIICIIHAGLEGVDIPLPQFRELYKYLCDLGADMIIAHHPHWAQGYEQYGNKYIFYSLGNFFFNLDAKNISGNIQEKEAYSLLLSFENGNFTGFEPIFHRLEDNGVLTCINECQANFSLKNLNKKLESPHYEKEIYKIAQDIYPIYEKYYDWIFLLCSSRLSTIQNLKMLIRKLLGRKPSLDALLLHNIQIETHRFVQELALKIKLDSIK